MDLKLIVLEACVGICTVIGIYIVAALTWFQCKPRAPPSEVEKPRHKHHPEASFRNKARSGIRANGNGHQNRPRNGQHVRRDMHEEDQRRRRNQHPQEDEEDKREKESDQQYDRSKRENGQRPRPKQEQQQQQQQQQRRRQDSQPGNPRKENGHHQHPRAQERKESARRPIPNDRQVREEEQDREQNSLHFVRNGNSRRPPQDVPVTTNHVVALQRLCLSAAWFVLIRYGMEHAILILSTTESFSWMSCEIIIRVHIGFYVVPLTVQYLFLWLKQRVLYLNPLLRHNSWSCTTCVSWLVIAIFLLSEIGSVTMFMVNEKYERNLTANATDNFTWAPCNPVHTGTLHDFIPWLVLGLLALTFQALFFVLFIQPLVCKAEAIGIVEMAIRHHHSQSVFSRIKRVFLASSTSAITDLLAIVGCMASGDLYISFVILDFNLLINQICVILSYQSWRLRFCPLCSGKPPDDDNLSVAFSRGAPGCNEGNSSRSPISSTSTGVEEVFE